MIKNTEGNLVSHIEDMLELKESLGYSRSTHEYFLNSFNSYCIEHFPNDTTVTQENATGWSMVRTSGNVNGLLRRISTIREFARYLNSVGVTAYVMPMDIVGTSKPFSPHVFTDRELTAFFRATDEYKMIINDPLQHLIVPVIFRLIYSCGLRPQEVRLLKRKDVDLKNGVLLITEAKRHRERLVALSDDILQICTKYEFYLEKHSCCEEYFFPGKNGDSRSKQWVRNQVIKCWRYVKLDGKAPRVYDFRHTFATRCLQRWLDEGKELSAWIPYLSAYMGHSDFSSTAYYIHLIPERLLKSPAINWSKFSELLPEVPSL